MAGFGQKVPKAPGVPHLWPCSRRNKGPAVPANPPSPYRTFGSFSSLPLSQGITVPVPQPMPAPRELQAPTMMASRMFWNSLRKPRV